MTDQQGAVACLLVTRQQLDKGGGVTQRGRTLLLPLGGGAAVVLELPPRMEGSFWVVCSGGATHRKFSGTVYMLAFFFVGCMEKFKLPPSLGPFLLNLAFTCFFCAILMIHVVADGSRRESRGQRSEFSLFVVPAAAIFQEHFEDT